ncbi:twin-arginine translocase subunit TatC [Rhodothermus marinus]|uniref:twin-arginine translocase subunit TatC n=1 Tax=Rhodothermus marinus TaxID=29549 RepID=UPI0037CC560F
MKLFGSRSSSPATTSPLPPAQGDGAPAGAAPEADMAEMSFLDHLEELRWRLIKGLAGVLISTILCSFFSKWIIDNILLGPTRPDFFMYRVFHLDAKPLELLNRTITGQFFAHIGTILFVGVIIGSPVLIYQIWKFIEPGLYPHEKQGMRFAAAFATGFFILGVLFGYLVITPLALQFFANYTISEQIINQFDITKYFNMVTMWAFGVGLLFELPVIVYFLAKMGLLTGDVLRKGRRYALIIALVLGALFTPPDPISQVLVAVPLLLLYELSIHIATIVSRRREEELRRALYGP